MIDVFIKTRTYDSEIRGAMYRLSMTRWVREPETRVVPMFDLSPMGYREFAENHSQSEIYCVADDDQLILGENWATRGMETLKGNSDYGMLCACSIIEWYDMTHKVDAPHVVEMHSIGAPYFVKRGTLDHFPDCQAIYMDGELSKVVTDRGLKTGIMPHLRFNHLGHGYSSVGGDPQHGRG